MLVHLFAFAANGNPQCGIERQKAKKTCKSTHTREDSCASYLQRHLELYIGEQLTPYHRLGVQREVLARLVKILAVLAIPLYDVQLLLSGIAIPLSRSSCCTIQCPLYYPLCHRRD